MAARNNEDESTQLNNNPTNYDSFKGPTDGGVTGMNFIVYTPNVNNTATLIG